MSAFREGTSYMKLCQILLPACLSLLVASCGSGQTIVADAGPQQSRVVLTSAPEVVTGGAWVGLSGFAFVTDCTDCIRVMSGTSAAAWQEVRVGGAKVLWADVWEVSGTVYLVASVIDSSDITSFYRYHDSGSDGLPDESTETLLFSSGTSPMYVTDVVWDEDEGLAYILDRRCQDVRVAEDTNSDGWPDTLRTAAFALSQDHSGLLNVLSITPTVNGIAGSFLESSPALGGGAGTTLLMYDPDGDLEADTVVLQLGQYGAPVTRGAPYDGQSQVAVTGGPSAAGATAQIWELDSNLDDVTLLGSVVLGSDGTGTVSLSRSLDEDEKIGVRFSGGAESQRIPTVLDDRPQLLGVDPDLIPMGQATAVTVEGVNLTSATLLRVYDIASDTTTSLSVATLVSTEQATFLLPAAVASSTAVQGFRVHLVPSSSASEESSSLPLDVDPSTVYGITGFSPTSGLPSTQVTITGSGFEELEVFAICLGGGVSAEVFTVDSDSQITVTVPAGAETGRIQVMQFMNVIMSDTEFSVP